MSIIITTLPKLEIYKDSKNEWRWNISVNGKIIASSSEGYTNKQDCIDNIFNVENRIKQLREKNLIKK